MTPISRDLLAALYPLLDRALDLGPAELAAWLDQLQIERPGVAGELRTFGAGAEHPLALKAARPLHPSRRAERDSHAPPPRVFHGVGWIAGLQKAALL